jgi:hypothetical protein
LKERLERRIQEIQEERYKRRDSRGKTQEEGLRENIEEERRKKKEERFKVKDSRGKIEEKD